MESKKIIEVLIGGKTYRIAGLESEEYVQSLARYIDNKLSELDSKSATSIAFKEAFPIILSLNIADDLFRERAKNNADGKNAADNAAFEEQILQQQKIIDGLNESLAKLQTEADENSRQSETWENIANQLREKNTENSKLQKEIESMTEEIQALQKKSAEKTLEINELNKKLIDKNKELNHLSKKLADKNNILNELNEKAAARNEKMSALNKERDELAVTVKKNKEEIGKLNSNLAELQAKVDLNAKATDSLQKEKTKAAQELDAFADENSKLNATIEALNKENSKLSADYKKLKANMPKTAELNAAIAALKAENQELDKRNAILEMELNGLKNK